MDKKNTLLLTVIAIATLLVAVVGATFAYFTAQNFGNGEVPVKVTTETTNASTIRPGEGIKIKANALNFANQSSSEAAYVGSQKGVANASVNFTASTGAKDTQQLCYIATLKIKDKGTDGIEKFNDGRKSNNIEYSTANKESKPELVFNIRKAAKQEGYDAGFSGSYTGYNTENAISGLGDYKTDILTATKICSNSEDYGQENQYVQGQCETSNISGWDITGKTGDIQIPLLSSESGFATEQNNGFVHKIEAKEGASYTDYWQIEAILVNHDFDQNQNTGKTFEASVDFEIVDCSTGEVIKSGV